MRNVLKKYFGFDEFWPLQEEIISTVLDGRDAFVLMPTGGGKSLCFQVPALMLPRVTLVISPLIALMKDQVDGLQANGVAAEFINSSLSESEILGIQKRVLSGEVKILYIAPERFAILSFKNFLNKLEISLIAIDEAHCISEWGHDFRPDYRNLRGLKAEFKAPVIALTATATLQVREDICKQLSLKKSEEFISSFNRANLKIQVLKKQDSVNKMVDLLKKYKGESAIVYCFSRKETEKLAKRFKSEGLKTVPYHAGLSSDRRKRTQDLFVRDEVDIIVATIAFGMGIDKPDVRLVVHTSFPKTLEGYYQEIGRAAFLFLW
jgi:ATP-dependent DNA helicase RecQ